MYCSWYCFIECFVLSSLAQLKTFFFAHLVEAQVQAETVRVGQDGRPVAEQVFELGRHRQPCPIRGAFCWRNNFLRNFHWALLWPSWCAPAVRPATALHNWFSRRLSSWRDWVLATRACACARLCRLVSPPDGARLCPCQSPFKRPLSLQTLLELLNFSGAYATANASLCRDCAVKVPGH